MQQASGESWVELTLDSPAGDQAFPGSLNLTVVYTLTDENELLIGGWHGWVGSLNLNRRLHTYWFDTELLIDGCRAAACRLMVGAVQPRACARVAPTAGAKPKHPQCPHPSPSAYRHQRRGRCCDTCQRVLPSLLQLGGPGIRCKHHPRPRPPGKRVSKCCIAMCCISADPWKYTVLASALGENRRRWHGLALGALRGSCASLSSLPRHLPTPTPLLPPGPPASPPVCPPTRSYFAETDTAGAATGAFLPVAGTPLDFTSSQAIGARINGAPALGGPGKAWEVGGQVPARVPAACRHFERCCSSRAALLLPHPDGSLPLMHPFACAETDGGYTVSYLNFLEPDAAKDVENFQATDE